MATGMGGRPWGGARIGRGCVLLVATVAVVLGIAGGSGSASSPAGAVIWPLKEPAEIQGFGDDNTGTRFELADEVASYGRRALKVIPSGRSDETKLALPLEGERLAAWEGAGEVRIRVYLPEENRLHPSMFFLGMASVSGEWTWVGGVFSETQTHPGWNDVVYPLAGTMGRIDRSGKYMVYLAFAGFNDQGGKIPLTEPFYIDGMEVIARSQEPRVRDIPQELKDEVATLLTLTDEALLDAIQRRTFDYFWNEANPANGLVKDRSTDDSPSSIAAVGFGLGALPIGVERGWISREEGRQRALVTLQTFAEGGVQGERGFFYHFVDMESGRRHRGSELSSIDTALFLAGALTAGQYFGGEVEYLANRLYQAVDWAWLLDGGETPAMGWTPERGFLDARWNAFNEGILLHILAIGSPTHPIPASAWDAIYRPIQEDHVALLSEVLFVYQYPLIWLDLRGLEDAYANYFNNAAAAARYNYRFTQERSGQYQAYGGDVWGLSASDGPAGYRAYGASEGNHDGTVAPYASIGSLPFTPDLSMKAIRAMLREYGPLVWGRYGFVSAFNPDEDWYSQEYIGIDQGTILLTIENVRSGLIWETLKQHPAIRRGILKVGLLRSREDRAINPDYRAEWRALEQAARHREADAVRAPGPVAVDGDLSDWSEAAFQTVDEEMSVPGFQRLNRAAHVLRSRFAAMWDDHFLYVAAEVADSVVVSNLAPDDRRAFYRTDSVEFYLDPARAGSNAGLVKLAVLPFDSAGRVQVVRHEDARPGPADLTAPGLLAASRRTDRGYAVELAVPLTILGVDGKAGVTLGFSHTIHNSNDERASIGEYVRANVLSWNPVPDVWAHPDAWGVLTLTQR